MTDEQNEIKYSMFLPRSKSRLLEDFPELATVQVFKKLRPEQLLFVWYYACEASPFADDDKESRKLRNCCDRAFIDQNHPEIKKILSGNISSTVQHAIAEMKKYRMGPRIRAKKMVEKIMTNYEHLINIDAKNTAQFANKDGEVDWSKKKAYIDSAATVSKNLPILISQAEGAFGITEEEVSETGIMVGGSLIDSFHDNEDN